MHLCKPTTTLASLEREYGMTYQRRVRIGAGVFNSGRSTACVFDVGPGHDWEDQMYRYSTAVPPVALPPAAAPIDTGFEEAASA